MSWSWVALIVVVGYGVMMLLLAMIWLLTATTMAGAESRKKYLWHKRHRVRADSRDLPSRGDAARWVIQGQDDGINRILRAYVEGYLVRDE